MRNRFAFDELIYKGRVVEVHRVGVPTPAGEVLPRDFIHYNGAAVIMPVLDDGSVALIRNERFAVNECLYELPAGMLDGDEDPAVGAARELAEETGFTAGCIQKLGTFYSMPGTSDERMHAFVATRLRPGPQRLEKYENIRVEIVSQPRLKQMVSDGTVHDAKTIAAVALYWLSKGMI